MTTRRYRVHGLHCADEIRAVRAALQPVAGVRDVQFDLLAERMEVTFEPGVDAHEAVTDAVAAAGLRAVAWTDSGSEAPHARRDQALATASGALLLAATVASLVEADGAWAALAHVAHHDHAPVVSTALFVGAAVCGLATTLPRGLRSLAAFRLDMHVLVIVAIAGAAVLGEWSEGATVAALFAIANALEAWSASRARHAVTGLMRLTPHHGHVLAEGTVRCVPVEHIAPGSTVLVRPGERVPVDGEVTAGRSAVDEAAVTGEAVPVAKRTGDRVFAGTLNGMGALEVRSTARAVDSAIARMQQVVEQARLRRTRAERWIERFAALYTPAVLAGALLIAVLPPLFGAGTWGDWFYRGLVATLIACPCALVISTPVTIVAALSSAARRQVLVKRGEALETLAQVRVVAYDKTGVVTRGEPVVEVFEPAGGHGDAEVLTRVLAIEQRSEHPLARAIVRFATARGVEALPATHVAALPGRGAEGVLDGRPFWIGSYRLAQEHHVHAPEVLARTAALEARGLTLVLCGEDDEVWAVVGLRDDVRDDARACVEALRAAGIRRQVLLTGDGASAGALVRRALGVEDVRASLLPEDKEREVRELAAAHGAVAMIGDGVNDTPAMAAAAVGVALGPRSTDVALETADIVIAADDLDRVPWTVRHARRALRVVQQNVVLAVGAKVVFLALAATGHATLWMAVAADTGATIVVTLNGLRLLRAKGAVGPASQVHAAAPAEADTQAEHATCGSQPYGH